MVIPGLETSIHRNARKGSGGEGFFIKDEILYDFTVSVLNNSQEDILWLKLEHKYENVCLIPCVCYLPPENSSVILMLMLFIKTCKMYMNTRMMV